VMSKASKASEAARSEYEEVEGCLDEDLSAFGGRQPVMAKMATRIPTLCDEIEAAKKRIAELLTKNADLQKENRDYHEAFMGSRVMADDGEEWELRGVKKVCEERKRLKLRVEELEAENNKLLSEIAVQGMNQNVTQNQLDEAVVRIAELEAVAEAAKRVQTAIYEHRRACEVAKAEHYQTRWSRAERARTEERLVVEQELAAKLDALRASDMLEKGEKP